MSSKTNSTSQFQKVRAEVEKKLHEKSQFTDFLGSLETKTGVDRFYIFSGAVGLLSFYLIFGDCAEFVCNMVGFLYPAYISIKAIESGNKEDDTQWLTYWVIFALLNLVEFFSDAIYGWFPIYWICKCAAFLWLYLPSTMGAQKIYVRFVRPFVQKHEKGIEEKLANLADTVKSEAEHLKNEAERLKSS